MSARTYTESITFATPPNGSTRLAVCPDCGAVVVNIPRHDKWHADQYVEPREPLQHSEW